MPRRPNHNIESLLLSSDNEIRKRYPTCQSCAHLNPQWCVDPDIRSALDAIIKTKTNFVPTAVPLLPVSLGSLVERATVRSAAPLDEAPVRWRSTAAGEETCGAATDVSWASCGWPRWSPPGRRRRASPPTQGTPGGYQPLPSLARRPTDARPTLPTEKGRGTCRDWKDAC